MRVVCQALAVALLLNTQQDLDVLTVLIAAGLFVTLHPRLDLVLPQRRVLCRLLLRSCTLQVNGTVVGEQTRQVTEDSTSVCKQLCEFTLTLEDFLDPSLKACHRERGSKSFMSLEVRAYNT